MRKDSLPDLLHLYHALGPSSRTLRRLLDCFDQDPSAIRRAGNAELGALGVRQTCIDKLASRQGHAVTRDLRWAENDGNHLIACFDRRYPALLREIADYPPLLYASGDCGLLQLPQIAIVGSRSCTPGGAHNAHRFAAELARAGLAITSGMALGIDSAAHRGALEVGGGTLAVLGTGIDLVYPAKNRRLAAEIRARGLLLSEFPLGQQAHAACFPQRNRIISGLALATLVVEAAARSGSLITARLAAEQGREVVALPGSVNNPQSRGCHRLIRDGAVLVENPGDITRELGGLFEFVFCTGESESPADNSELDAAQRRLLQAIDYDPVDVDLLVQRSGLTIDQVSSMLVSLELKDLIQPAPGGCFVRI